MKKILVIANYNHEKGGISVVVKNHIEELIKEGFQVTLFNTKRSPVIRLILIFPLLFLVKKHDILHIHGCSGLGFYPVLIGIFASKIVLKRKTIITYHGGGAKRFLKNNAGWVRWFLKKADFTTVMSTYLQKIFLNYKIKTVVLKNLISIKNDIDTSVSFDYPRLVSIRSLEPIYNIQDIITAFILLKQDYTNATLNILGSGSLENKLKAISQEMDGINFIGQVRNTDIPDIIIQNNIFLSVPCVDNQPLSILEAFTAGIPVISSNVGGVPDMIQDGVNGFLVDANAPHQIAQKIIWIFNSKEELPQVLRNAKESVKSYQWPEIKKVLLNLYFN